MSHARRLWLLTAILAILVQPGIAQDQQKQSDAEHRAKSEVRYLAKESLGQGVTQAHLSNGMTVLVRENHAAPVATVRSYVENTGSAYEGEYLGTGISHLLEHIVAGGTTEKRSEEEIRDLTDSLGGKTNAYTSSNVTAYHIDAPAKRVNLAIELIADGMQHASIPEDEYRRELGVVQRELEVGESERGRQRYQAMKRLIYTEHPMRHPTIGYLPVLQNITRQDVLDYYESRYVPQNMVFVVAGDVQTEKILDEVLQNFQGFHRTTERGPVLSDEPDQASPRSTKLQMEGETVRYSVAWPTVPLQHDDLYPLDVASYLLTNGDSSRLARRLKIEQPLASSVSSASYTPGFVKGWFEVTVECDPGNLAQCREIIDEEIDRLQEELVTDEELARVKRQKAAEHVFGQQTVQEQAESLSRSYRSTGDPLFGDQYVQGIQGVTADEVRQVARRYFRPERRNTVTIEPLGQEQKQAEDAAESVESPIVRKQLDNGLTVLLKRHSVLPMVSIQAFARAGVLSDTDKTKGRAALASELMARGTEKYTGREIAEYFDSIGGKFSTDSQRNSTFLQCSVLKDDLDTSLDYVHQVLFRPTFPQGEFQKVQKLQLNQIASREANPQAQILDFWTRQLPDQSPYSRTVLGTRETVSGLTVAQCRKFHGQYFAPENMVLAVFGDIDTDKTFGNIKELFGGVPPAKDFQFPDFGVGHTSSQTVRKHLPSRRPNTAMVVIGYPTFSMTAGRKRAALQMLNTVLTGGGGAGGRLFEELRGQRLVYYVFGFELTGLAPGYFVFMAQTRPETVEEVIGRIQANLEKIRKEGIPSEEFEQAREKALAGHALENTTASAQAFQSTLHELYGLGYDYDETFDERINAVTVEDVQRVLEEHFHNPIIAVSSPEAAQASGSE